MTVQQLADELGLDPGDVALVAEWLLPGDAPIPDELHGETADDVRALLAARERAVH